MDQIKDIFKGAIVFHYYWAKYFALIMLYFIFFFGIILEAFLRSHGLSYIFISIVVAIILEWFFLRKIVLRLPDFVKRVGSKLIVYYLFGLIKYTFESNQFSIERVDSDSLFPIRLRLTFKKNKVRILRIPEGILK